MKWFSDRGWMYVVVGALLIAVLASCASAPLPHRPFTGNHGQGMAPPITCPHQYREIVTADDGVSVFLYCWGKRTETMRDKLDFCLWLAVVILGAPWVIKGLGRYMHWVFS